MFKRAERKKAKLRLALLGPSGSGKTYSALQIAKGLGGSIAFIDTENGSGELYAHLCDYDICQIMPPFTPEKYVEAIHAAEQAGYDTIVIDSLSHAWSGAGGLLEQVDQRKGSGNQFAAWRDITPKHNAFVDAMVQSPAHIVATMRTKTAHEMQRNDQGKMVPVKIGMQPVQRDGLEYEFTVVFDLRQEDHMATAGKDRTSLFDGQVFKPTPETGQTLRDWLKTGTDPDEAMVAEAKALIDGATTVTGLQSLWREHSKRWQSRPGAFQQITPMVTARNKALEDQQPGNGPFQNMEPGYTQPEQSSCVNPECVPGGGGMADPMTREEREAQQAPPVSDLPQETGQQEQGTDPKAELTEAQRKAIMAYYNKRGMPYSKFKEKVLENLSHFFQLEQPPLKSIKDITVEMAHEFIDSINQEAA